jgi:hypothetical protein
MIHELNPNHPVTRTVHDHWHKICAILLSRPPYNGRTEISEEEIKHWASKFDGYSVVIKDADHKLTLFMVDAKEGERLSREEGGLPA